MCAITGAVILNLQPERRIEEANRIMNHIMNASRERGRDGYGYSIDSDGWNFTHRNTDRYNGNAQLTEKFFSFGNNVTLIGNLRAEPTTEYVEVKHSSDQQPYKLGDWEIVHNGTIANDADLRTNEHKTAIDSAAIVETLNLETGSCSTDNFLGAVNKLKGSYAILARNNLDIGNLFLACNYRPIWYIKTDLGVFFASCETYFPEEYTPVMMTPYSAHHFSFIGTDLMHHEYNLRKPTEGRKKCLVVCSGGLDSTVAAKVAQKQLGMDVELIHFIYGCRAEEKEIEAVYAVGKALGVEVTVMNMPIYSESDSPLLDRRAKAAPSEQGAEYAHEWVPARNLVLLSLATAYAEAKGFSYIALGNNLEEAGAYPDNEPEFIKRFAKILPFAVGDGKKVDVIMPVGNLMKHEIVALGHKLGAPMDKTWSCYNHNDKHCGKCGPCFMRKTAFEINKLPEVIEYVSS